MIPVSRKEAQSIVDSWNRRREEQEEKRVKETRLEKCSRCVGVGEVSTYRTRPVHHLAMLPCNECRGKGKIVKWAQPKYPDIHTFEERMARTILELMDQVESLEGKVSWLGPDKRDCFILG